VAIKTILLLLGFFFSSVGALFVPLIGVIGYILHYQFWPDNHWWGREISDWGLRYAFTIGVCLLLGTLLNKQKLALGGKAMRTHEWLLILFWLVAMLSLLTGLDLTFMPHQKAHQMLLVDKLSKVLLFCLLMSHVATTLKRLDLVLWALIVGTLYVGYEAWAAPVWKFTQARLQGIGGPDYRESSYLGAHFAMILPLIGAQFLRGGWKAKVVCAVAGGFALNGLILTRTRAAFLAVCVGLLAALLLALRGRRRRICVYMLPALMAAVYLTDTGFRQRMKTIRPEPLPADTSAVNRLEIWRASGEMFLQHPLGVGVGNFRTVLSHFTHLKRRDAHNTYIRCAVELGAFGVMALGVLVISAGWCLYRANRWAWRCPYTWQIRYYTYGLSVSLVVMLTTAMFMTQLYIEEFWWMLTLPVCLLRAAELEYLRTGALVTETPEQPDGTPEGSDLAPARPGTIGFA
jgi:O-antigen ligase